MADIQSNSQALRETRFVLHPHRSLSPRGFYILMACIGLVSFIVGLAFLLIGAWPVFGFFGLDVALIYLAFRLNYRAARQYETISLTPDILKLSRYSPSGQSETFEFNPYWARVRLSMDRPDGRTSLHLGAQGREVRIGSFLTDDERRDVAHALTGALLASRSAQAF